MSEIDDLLERFRRGPELVAVAMTGAAGAELDWKPSPDKWSLREIVAHLADSEIVGADRFRRTIAEDSPTIVAYDQDAWARNLDYSRRRISQAMEAFRRLRGENHDLLKGLPEAAFERAAIHSERGRLTLADLLRTYAEHAEKHAGQLRALRQAYKQSKPQP